MPAHEIALPAGSKNLNPAFPTITRYSKDGDIPVIRLFAGDNFIGDVLEGSWVKGEDALMTGPYIAIISGGQLELTGKSDSAATYRNGWVNGQNPFLISQNAYVDVHMKTPAVTPSNTIAFEFYLRSGLTGQPYSDDNSIRVRLDRTSTPEYRIAVWKRINGAWTALLAYTAKTNEEGTFRIKFRPDDAKLDVYYHDGSGDVNESSDELTLSDDTLDLAFTIGYPAFQLATSETTNRTMISEKVEVNYPNFDVNYDLSDEVFQGEGSDPLTRALDTVGFNDGVIDGAMWIKDGKYSKALDFDGVDDGVAISSIIISRLTAGVSFWIKTSADYTGKYINKGFILAHNISSACSNIGIIGDGTGPYQLHGETNLNEETIVNIQDIIPVGEWVHVAISFDTSIAKTYVNGVLIGTSPALTADWTFDRFGIDEAGTAHFEGNIDDIRVYDVPLDLADIQALMADNPPSSGLTAEWLFDGGNTRGDVVCYDTRGETDESLWQRVYTEDHEFSGNCVIENGLIRVLVTEAIEYGLHLYFWDGKEYTLFLRTQPELRDDGKPVKYPFLLNIGNIDRAESIEIKVRVCDTLVEDSDYYIDLSVTLTRGMHHCTYRIDGISLEQDIRFPYFGVQQYRFGYCGDVESKGIGHYQLSLSVTNTVMTDNFMAAFKDTGLLGLFYIAVNEKPSAFFSYIGQYIGLYSLLSADLFVTKIHLGFTPFRKIANLFEEAEDCTKSSGATVVADGLASGGYMIELDADAEWVHHELTGITDIPLGRYLLIARVKDTNQIANDLEMSAYNSTDSRFLNEEMAEVTRDLTGTYAYYSIVFDVIDADSGDTLEFFAQKGTATANTIKVDYFLIIPIGDGESFPQDIAHSALRALTKKPKLIER